MATASCFARLPPLWQMQKPGGHQKIIVQANQWPWAGWRLLAQATIEGITEGNALNADAQDLRESLYKQISGLGLSACASSAPPLRFARALEARSAWRAALQSAPC